MEKDINEIKEKVKEELLKEVSDWFCDAYCRFYGNEDYCKTCPIKDKSKWLTNK